MTSVALPLLLLLCLQVEAQGKENECYLAVRVKRNTEWITSIMDTLKINCTVEHCGMQPNVTWCKLVNGTCILVTATAHTEINFEESKAGTSLYFLKFVNISLNDAGLYRCKMSGNVSSVSHSIKVIVIAAKANGNSKTNETRTTHIKINLEASEARTSIYFLKFVNISMNDAGLYRCKISGDVSSVSHSINVTVNAAKDTGNSQTNETRTTTTPNGPEQNGSTPLNWLLYIYILAGVLVLVVIVVATSCMLKSKGSKRPTAAIRTQDQVLRFRSQSSVSLKKLQDRPSQPSLQASPYPTLPDRPRSIRSPHAQRPPSIQSSGVPGPAPAPPPIRRSSHTKRSQVRQAPPPSSSSGAARPAAVGSSGVYDNNREEAETPIVYAALDHQVARKGRSHGHTYTPMEELTEYAAIRVS